MKKKIHINTKVLAINRKKGERKPPITCKTYNSNEYGHTVDIVVNDSVVASVKYRPDTPLSCGATCWVETEEEVRVY